ncbi:MAG TPA: CPBP family glutamic-type intramembrane protease [Terriglobia bacterium]|nr:CPBP family glutamic-type intramembrane protease [Terriglobia bacterium]
MVKLAAAEVAIVFGGVILFIWRVQFTFPDFALYLLGFLVLTFFIHRDTLQNLGIGSRGLISGLKTLAAPTAAVAGILLFAATLSGKLDINSMAADKWWGLGRYFAWCLFQEFGLQSFFTNRLSAIFKQPNRTAWASAVVFGSFHIPNPVLIPVTLAGGYLLTRIFMKHRNLVPLAVAQAIVGSLLSMALPPGWHHGLRVGPGYYR